MGIDGAASTAAADSRGGTLPGFPVPSGILSLVLSSNSMLFQSLGPQHPRRPPCGLLDPTTHLRSPLPRWHLVVSLLMSPSIRPPQFSACQALDGPLDLAFAGVALWTCRGTIFSLCRRSWSKPASWAMCRALCFCFVTPPAKGGNEPGLGHRIGRLSQSPDLNSSFIWYL